MAEVSLAIDTETGNSVALKRILPHIAEEELFARMFADEAKIVSEFTHPDIPRCLDYGHVDGIWYITFEYVDGEDLRAIYDAANERNEKLPLHFVLHVIARVARSLAYAHEKLDGEGQPFDVVHRDVSPQNVIVGFDGSVKLIDFGVAKAAGKLSRTEAGAIKGKFAYLSPEQARGLEVDLRADIFSLGICLWELLTGERLFAADNEVLVLEKLRTSLVPLPSTKRSGLPSALDAIVMRSLAKDRDDRYQTSSALADDLESFARRSNLHCSAHEITQYMRSLFELEVERAEVSATETETETRVMSDNKGSDLDIFESLGKKGLSSTSVLPPDAALASSAQLPPTATSSRSVPPPPPPPFSAAASAPPPAPPTAPWAEAPPPAHFAGGGGGGVGGGMKQTLMGIPMPPPPSMRPSTSPPPPPGRSSLPAVAPPPRASGSTVSSVPPPPPVATRPAPSEPHATEMDWDDEDEATQIFDKAEDSSRAEPAPMPRAGTTSPSDFSPKRTLVMGGAVPLPPVPAPLPLPTPLPARPVPLPPQTLHGIGPSDSAPVYPHHGSTQPLSLPPQFAAPSVRPHPSVPAMAPMETTAVVRPESRASGKGVLVAIAVASLVVVGGIGAFFMFPKKGKVDIDVADTTGNKVDEVEIYIDGTKRCDTRPCRVELEAGPRHIKVATRGGATRFTDEKVVEVRAGETQSVTLIVAKGAQPNVTASTSLVRVSSTQPGITLFIDGKETGPLPQDVKDVAAGPHTLKFVAGERYAELEKPITVEAGKPLDVSAVLLKVKKGVAKVSLNTPGARVFLVSGAKRKELANLPLSIDIDTSEPWALEASKPNMVDFRQAITFEDGHAEKAFAVTLYAKGAEAKDPTATTTAEATAPGSILMNSIPPSTCFLDGAALGQTPQVREVKPGNHTVKYVNSELGVSQVVTVKVVSGKRSFAAVKLKAKPD